MTLSPMQILSGQPVSLSTPGLVPLSVCLF